MKGIKVVAAVIASAALVAGLGACSSGSGNSSSGPTTITFWNGFTGPDRPAVEQVVKNFNASQKKVKIDMTIEPWDTFYAKLLPAYAAGNGPTLVGGMDPAQFPGYASKGVLKDVKSFYSGWPGSKNLIKADVNSTIYKGVQYGMPMTGSTTMLYYNKKLLAAAGITNPPTTQTELGDDAVKLTHYNASSPTSSVYGIALPDNNAPTTWEALMQGNGGGVVSDDGKTSLLGSPASIQTITYWTDLLREQHVGPTDLAGAASDSLFEAGKVAFNITGAWASAGYKAAGIDFGIVNVPRGTARQAAQLVGGDFAVDAKATAAQTAAAYTFVKYWESPKSQLIYSLQSGSPPVLTTITSAQLASNPTAQIFYRAKGGIRQYPGELNYAQMQTDVFVPMLQEIENGKGTAAQLMPLASQKIAALIK